LTHSGTDDDGARAGTDAVTGPFALTAGNPFVVSGYDNRLWIADFGGSDTIVVDPTRLSSR